MGKTTMAMAFGMALSLGAVGVAAAQSQQQPPRQEQSERGMRRGPGRGGELFKGITLTEDQKARLKELRKNDKATASNEQFRKAMADIRAARQRGDTAAARAQMEALRPQMQQARERELAAMRSILTPEQQKQFDANVAAWKERAAAHRDWRGGGHEGRHAGAPNDR